MIGSEGASSNGVIVISNVWRYRRRQGLPLVLLFQFSVFFMNGKRNHFNFVWSENHLKYFLASTSKLSKRALIGASLDSLQFS
jgi:hypothetical protein